MTKYIITNDHYSNQPDLVSFGQLIEMCEELGFDTNLRRCNGKIIDGSGVEVATEATDEQIFQAGQDEMEQREQLRETAKDVVRDWSARNPEANPGHYDNHATQLDWERRAISAVLAAWEANEDGEAAITALAAA